MSWSARFPEPIALPDGGKIVTLKDAGEHIMKLPKTVHDTVPWQNAMSVLIQAAEGTGPIDFARIGMMQALFPKAAPVYHSVKKDPVWRNQRKLVRDR